MTIAETMYRDRRSGMVQFDPRRLGCRYVPCDWCEDQFDRIEAADEYGNVFRPSCEDCAFGMALDALMQEKESKEAETGDGR